MKDALAIVAGVAVLGLFCFAMWVGGMREIEATKKAKLEALEYAKQGWVYKCGWSCEWKRVEVSK